MRTNRLSESDTLAGRRCGGVKFLEAGGFRLSYLDLGEGSDEVIWVHGLYNSGTSHNPTVVKLAESFRLVAPDIPGHGGSGAFPDEASISEAARAVCEVARLVCQTPVSAIAGYSIGGVIALEAVRQNPEIAERIVLVASPADSSPLPLWARAMMGRHSGPPAALAMKMAIMCGVGASRLIPGSVGRFARMLADGAGKANWRASMDLVRSAASADRLELADQANRRPVLLVAGTSDYVVPAAHARLFQALIGSAETVWLEGEGHLAPYTVPVRVASAIADFALGESARD